MPRQARTTLVHPSPLLTSPFKGVDGRLCREGGTQQQSIPLPAHPTLGQCCMRRDELQQSSYIPERGILSPLQTLRCQWALSPLRNMKRNGLPRNITVMLPSVNADRHHCATRPSPSAPLSRRLEIADHSAQQTGSEYPLPEPPWPEHSPVSSLTPTQVKSPTALHKRAVPEHPLPESPRPEHSPFPLRTPRHRQPTYKEGGEEAVRGETAEGWWGGGGSFPLPSQHHTPLPSSDAHRR